MTKIAVLGTGKMGGAIAQRLKVRGFDISVWDRTKSKAEALQVGPVVDSPADAAGAADVEDLEAVRPVLQQLGDVQYVGDVASAAALKLIANSFQGIVSAGAAELMAAGTAQGLAPEQIFTILSRIAPGLKVRESGFVRSSYEPVMFAVRDILKDLDLALGLYQRAPGAGSKVPLTAMTRELYAGVAARTPDLDISAITTAASTSPPTQPPDIELAS